MHQAFVMGVMVVAMVASGCATVTPPRSLAGDPIVVTRSGAAAARSFEDSAIRALKASGARVAVRAGGSPGPPGAGVLEVVDVADTDLVVARLMRVVFEVDAQRFSQTYVFRSGACLGATAAFCGPMLMWPFLPLLGACVGSFLFPGVGTLIGFVGGLLFPFWHNGPVNDARRHYNELRARDERRHLDPKLKAVFREILAENPDAAVLGGREPRAQAW